MVEIGEAVAVTNSATIAEALEQAARSGLERKWVYDGFETVGSEGVANVVCEAVSRSGTSWIWNEGLIVDIIDIVDDVDIVDIDVPVRRQTWQTQNSDKLVSPVGSIDNCGEFWDEYTGERLPSEEVARARSDEIDGLKQYGVFEKVSVEE